jgi:hypothetical protein
MQERRLPVQRCVERSKLMQMMQLHHVALVDEAADTSAQIAAVRAAG